MLTLQEAQEWIAAQCHSPYYESQYRAMEADYLPTLCRNLEPVRPRAGLSRALDIGPGWGTMTLWLASRGWQVTMVDVQPLGHYVTERTLDGIGRLTGRPPTYLQQTVCDPLPFTEPFHLVLMTQVIPHLKWRPDGAIRNVAAVTAPDGHGSFVATVLDRAAYPKVRPPYRHWRDVPARGEGDPTSESVVCMYDRQELQGLLRQGFPVVAVVRPSTSTCLFAFCTTGSSRC